MRKISILRVWQLFDQKQGFFTIQLLKVDKDIEF